MFIRICFSQKWLEANMTKYEHLFKICIRYTRVYYILLCSALCFKDIFNKPLWNHFSWGCAHAELLLINCSLLQLLKFLSFFLQNQKITLALFKEWWKSHLDLDCKITLLIHESIYFFKRWGLSLFSDCHISLQGFLIVFRRLHLLF